MAILDTGVALTHPDLAANLWNNPGETTGNGTDDDANGYIDDVYGYDFLRNDASPNDESGHGTCVAGVVGAVGNNAQGVTGVAWNVRLMSLKFLGPAGEGTVADAIEGIDYARLKGAKIINASWTVAGSVPAELQSAVQRAHAAGVLIVAAAGNTATNNNTTPVYPANYTTGNVISVAASNASDENYAFTNWGSNTVHLAAPGVDVLSTNIYTSGSWYGYMNGTSIAVPHVTGALVLLYSRFPQMTHIAARFRILASVDPATYWAARCTSGGRLNVYASLLNAAPTAIPLASPITAEVGDLISFDGTRSTDAEGPIASYAWDFGDGTTGTGSAPTHIYAYEGTFKATLTVTDGAGATNTATLNVMIGSSTPLFYSLGVFRNGVFYLDENRNGLWDGSPADSIFAFGSATDVAVVGDWDGDGQKEIGVFRSGAWYLDWNGNGQWDGAGADRIYAFGLPADVPVVGDWNGTGADRIGVKRGAAWYQDVSGDGAWGAGDRAFSTFGLATDVPIVGDWNGDGTDEIGVKRGAAWYLDMDGNNAWNAGDLTFSAFGFATDTPIVGDWNGDGTDEIGVKRGTLWYLDMNGSKSWDVADRMLTFGLAADKPAIRTP